MYTKSINSLKQRQKNGKGTSFFHKNAELLLFFLKRNKLIFGRCIIKKQLKTELAAKAAGRERVILCLEPC